MGAIWIGPGGEPNGDGDRPDLGHANAVATVRECLDAGIREFDTAPWYGSGAARNSSGRALCELREAGFTALDGVRVATKVGRLVRTSDGQAPMVPFDAPDHPPLASRCFVNSYTADGARLSFRESAARLGMDKVHGLRVHDPNDNSINRRGAPGGWVDEVAIALGGPLDGGCLAELRAMRQDGTIAEVSLGMNCNQEAHQGVPDEILRLVSNAPRPFDTALLAGGWNLLSQAGQACFEECDAAASGTSLASSPPGCSSAATRTYQRAPPAGASTRVGRPCRGAWPLLTGSGDRLCGAAVLRDTYFAGHGKSAAGPPEPAVGARGGNGAAAIVARGAAPWAARAECAHPCGLMQQGDCTMCVACSELEPLPTVMERASTVRTMRIEALRHRVHKW